MIFFCIFACERLYARRIWAFTTRRPEAVDTGAEALAGYAELGRAVDEAVRKASEGRRVVVAFSGGLDSGLTAALASRYAESVV